MKQPQTFQLKVATAKVKKQVKDGPLFFILPTLLVAGVIAFCYAVPAPARDKAPESEAAAVSPAPEEQEIIGVVYDESAVPMEESAFMAEEEPPMADAEYQDVEEVVEDEGEETVAAEEEESPADGSDEASDEASDAAEE